MNIDLCIELAKLEKPTELGLLSVRKESEIFVDKRSRHMVAGLCQRTKRVRNGVQVR